MFVLPEAQLFHLVRKKLKRDPVSSFFEGKNVLLILGVGAFTEMDKTSILEYEAAYDDLCKEFELDDIFYLTMNDPFVLDAWGKSLKIKKVKLLPDGNGALSLRINQNDGLSEGDCVCTKFNMGMYRRNWRSVVLVQDLMAIWNTAEPAPKGTKDEIEPDLETYVETNLENILIRLRNRNQSDKVAEENKKSLEVLQMSSPQMGGGSVF